VARGTRLRQIASAGSSHECYSAVAAAAGSDFSLLAFCSCAATGTSGLTGICGPEVGNKGGIGTAARVLQCLRAHEDCHDWASRIENLPAARRSRDS
jgi:hypothetical protein